MKYILIITLLVGSLWANDFTKEIKSYKKQNYKEDLSRYKKHKHKEKIVLHNQHKKHKKHKKHKPYKPYRPHILHTHNNTFQWHFITQYTHGDIYLNNYDLVQDYKEDVRVYAHQGDSDAQYDLGLMYYNGQGVQQDKIKAYKWWLRSARAGNIFAQNSLDVLCRQSPWACK
jgi:TPR repeat protein